MSDDPNNPTPTADPTPDQGAGVSTPDPQPQTQNTGGPQDAAEQQAPTATETPSGGSGGAPVQSQDDLYDAAFNEFLSSGTNAEPSTDPEEWAAQMAGQPSADDSSGQPAPGQASDQQGTGEQPQPDQAGGLQLSEQDQQLLQRLHVPQQVVEHMEPQQAREFLDTQHKRERDQQAEYNRLKQGGQQQGQAGEQGGDDSQQQPEQGGEGEGQPPDAETALSELRQEAEEFQRTYGEEAKGFTDKVDKALTAIRAEAQQGGDTQQLQQQNQQMAGLIGELTIEQGMRDLASDFPSLSKPEVRQRVEQRMKQDWPNSQHRKSGGSMPQRITAALRDAARAELGSTTEAAAQVSLANRTKERLQQQPSNGSGRGNPTPMSQEDVYDQALNRPWHWS